MCQTLCYIPETFCGLPVFGWGWGLILLCICIGLSHAWQYLQTKHISDIGGSFGLLLVGGIVLVGIIPNIAESGKGVPIRGYGLCLLFGILLGCSLVVYLAKQKGIVGETAASLCFWTTLTGVIGARIFYVTEYWQEMLQFDRAGQFMPMETFFNIVNIAKGGLVVFGSILGGMLGGFVYMRLRKMPVLKSFDCIAVGLMLGIAIGRIGCLLNGCCFGGITALPWGITFPQGSPVHSHQLALGYISDPQCLPLPVHPTQIYSSVSAFCICGILLFLNRLDFYKRQDGLVFATFLMLYPAVRFILEMIRTDEASFLGTGFTVSQNVSMAVFVAGAALFAKLTRKRLLIRDKNKGK